MKRKRWFKCLGALPFCVLLAKPASAAPTMIRLGYTNCVACHLSPQGRGLLTEYGKGIDEAQSARQGIYLSPEGVSERKIFQDLRLLTQLDATSSTGVSHPVSTLCRFVYRNSTSVSPHSRISTTFGMAFPSHASSSSPEKSGPRMPALVVSKALWEYRPKNGIELAVGRDYLPSGVEIADQSAFIRARNGQGLTDFPTQAKLFLWSPRFQVVPYIFGPSGQEKPALGQRGGGLMAEVVTGNQRVVLGVASRFSGSEALSQQMIGGYARMGFGRWGILTEHDLTRRKPHGPGHDDFNQYAGYSQFFFVPREWLVTSVTLEQLKVGHPFREDRFRIKPEVSMRLTSNLTVLFSARNDRSAATRNSWAYSLQLYVKSVN